MSKLFFAFRPRPSNLQARCWNAIMQVPNQLSQVPSSREHLYIGQGQGKG